MSVSGFLTSLFSGFLAGILFGLGMALYAYPITYLSMLPLITLGIAGGWKHSLVAGLACAGMLTFLDSGIGIGFASIWLVGLPSILYGFLASYSQYLNGRFKNSLLPALASTIPITAASFFLLAMFSEANYFFDWETIIWGTISSAIMAMIAIALAKALASRFLAWKSGARVAHPIEPDR